MSSDETIEQAAAAFQDHGDAADFGLLVDQLQDRFYRVAYRVVGEGDTALDVVQDSFVKIHGRIDRWDRQARFTSWAYRIVTNVAIDALRRRAREQKAWEGRAAEESLVQEDESMQGVLSAERTALVEQVKSAIDELPPGQRAIVALRHYEGFSLKEIADVRGCALGTVKSTLHQAFRSLRRSLGNELLEQLATEAS